jgi:urease accessory protein
VRGGLPSEGCGAAPPGMPVGPAAAERVAARGWAGRLALDFERRGQTTLIARRRHSGPLLVQRAFHEVDGTCQVYVLHPPGGVVGGDTLSIEVKLQPESRALLTSPAATKLYRSAGLPARLEQHFVLGPDAVFEWLPQETIVFHGAVARSTTLVELDRGAQFAGWDIVCLGHDERGFSAGQLVQRWHISRASRVLWAERTEVAGGSAALTARWGLAGRPVVATFVATGALGEHVTSLREAAASSERDWYGATLLGEVLVCRYLGYSAEAAKRFFCKAWDLLRRHGSGRAAVPPRVWAT